MENFWKIFLEKIKEKTSPHIFETWFKQLHLINFSYEAVTIAVPNKFSSDWLNTNYRTVLVETIREITRKQTELTFEINETLLQEPTPEIAARENTPPSLPKNINRGYTFSNFVVGSSNQFANAASLAVADNPGRTYNPLFIYGGVGLGKTHLMHAIVHNFIHKYPALNVYYDTSENFTNEMINSIRFEKMASFRKKYRNIDILLLDDIQFIAGKERTQEEFFHTFNALFELKKQIVVSSDKKPQDIQDLEERLLSRFQWGLIADIQPPDTETKVAILKKKALSNKIQLSNEVAFLLAHSVKSNIRELEGLLTRLSAYASLYQCDITIDFTKDVLKDFIKVDDKEPTPEEIHKAVSKYFNIKVSDLKGKKKHNSIVFPRQVAMFIMRKMTKLSFPEIGNHFGGRDHSTVIHSIKKIERLYSDDQQTRNVVDNITKKI